MKQKRIPGTKIEFGEHYNTLRTVKLADLPTEVEPSLTKVHNEGQKVVVVGRADDNDNLLVGTDGKRIKTQYQGSFIVKEWSAKKRYEEKKHIGSTHVINQDGKKVAEFIPHISWFAAYGDHHIGKASDGFWFSVSSTGPEWSISTRFYDVEDASSPVFDGKNLLYYDQTYGLVYGINVETKNPILGMQPGADLNLHDMIIDEPGKRIGALGRKDSNTVFSFSPYNTRIEGKFESDIERLLAKVNNVYIALGADCKTIYGLVEKGSGIVSLDDIAETKNRSGK